MLHKDIIDKMSLVEKIALCSGADYWTTKAFPKHDIPSIRVNDGPHGLRIQKAAADNLGINKSIPATCFPTACTTSASWDRKLLREMGKALGEEAMQEGTAVLLGPGVNIKRNPLCGRNFEYFSEDPYIAGELASAWISGVQSKGVGVSLKHFAGNSQENHRLCSNSIIDERALREIYLSAFEKAVKKAKPTTVMCAYNLVNGTHCNDNKYLLTDILRFEWGFEGAVMTDWGATNNRVEAFKAGLDLEMPGSKGTFDKEVLDSVLNGELSEESINKSVDRMLSLIFSSTKTKKESYKYNIEEHHQLCRKIAARSAVLLKNDDNILPIDKTKKVALIGSLAKDFRYQGAGSSKINPHKISNVLDGLNENSVAYSYYAGYDRSTANAKLVEEAVQGAKDCDIAIIVVGLTDDFESEGFDRTSLDIPESQDQLISAVVKANPNVVIVLLGGSPVTMPWIAEVRAVLNMYLSGQAGGLAAADILTGKVNPSGKLAETYPLRYDDVVCSDTFGINPKQVLYKESIYVGYRYYDKVNKGVLFPFGFGLSYTQFQYSDLKITGTSLDEICVRLKVKNVGEVAGAEVVQLYIGKPKDGVFCPPKELKDFDKVFLNAGEETELVFNLNKRSFAYYNVNEKDWIAQSGEYSILVGASSRDIRLHSGVSIVGENKQANLKQSNIPSTDWYYKPVGKPTQESFEALLNYKVKPLKKQTKGNFDLSCTLSDMKESSVFIRIVNKIIEIVMGIQSDGIDYSNPNFKMIMETAVNVPLKNLILMSGGRISSNMANGLILIANGHLFKGMGTTLKKR
ncbi:MAG TPA: glycoside hydrolase family 3 C-terminal domain-containing protein [Ruminiclostridium sp.]